MFDNKFWMVLVDGTERTRRRHPTKELAIEAAERLNVKTRRPVFILELIKTINKY